MNFVSEKDVKKDGEEEPQDNRTLYERLKEVRDKKQAEIEEERALKNQFRGIDADDAEYLNQVSRAKLEAERQKKQEEQELLKSQREAMKTQPNQPVTSGTSASFTMPKIQAGSLKSKTKSNEGPTGLLIRKRKRSDDDGKDDKGKKDSDKQFSVNSDNHPIIQKVGEYPSAMIRVGSLPGLGMYDSSSEDDSFDEDEEIRSDDIMKAVHGLSNNTGTNDSSTKTATAGSKSASNTSLNQTT